MNKVLSLGSVEPYALRTGAEFTPLSAVWKEMLSKALSAGDLDCELWWLWFLTLHGPAIQDQSGAGVV